jgi:hypothetical protein
MAWFPEGVACIDEPGAAESTPTLRPMRRRPVSVPERGGLE